MARRIRPISHEDRLSVVDHLDELRSRLIVCVLRVRRRVGAHRVAERPRARDHERAAPGRQGDRRADPADHAWPCGGVHDDADAGRRTSRSLIAAPVILYQLYAFVLPAFSPSERRVATPLLLLVPILFIAGRGVLLLRRPRAGARTSCSTSTPTSSTRRSERKDYYSFVSLLMLAMGLGFQIPVGHPRGLQARPDERRAAAPQPPLRDRRHRRPGLAAARRSTR